MNKRVLIILLTFSTLLCSCIEEYYPEDDNNNRKIVIEGILNDIAGRQTVNISYSSSIAQPEFTPFTGCLVEVYDAQNNVFQYDERSDGRYTRDFSEDEITAGNSYILRVLSPNGDEYLSDYVVMNSSKPVDSIYYIEEDVFSFGSEYNYEGVQFYADIRQAGDSAEYYAFQILETWETYTPLNIQYVYDSLKIIPVYDYLAGRNHCWLNNRVEQVFVAATTDQVDGISKNNSLHFVDNYSSRLKYKYSILVYQLSINRDAYDYYSALNSQSFGSVGIYETQPRQIKGNIYNVSGGDEVLGFFMVGAASKKRVFVDGNFDFYFYDYTSCTETEANIRAFKDMASLWPIYLSYYNSERHAYGYAQKSCFDCTYKGGELTRPDFWNE